MNAQAMMDAAYVAERLDRWYGVYPALVTDLRDPDGQGRSRSACPGPPTPRERRTSRGPGSPR